MCEKWIGVLIFCFVFVGCKHEIEYRYVIKQTGPRPTFNQVFVFFTVDDAMQNKIEMIYETMTDEELVDLKYNYYSPIPVFGYANNSYNPQNTIYYSGNVIIIRGSDLDDSERLFKTALESWKNDDLNKIILKI